MAIDIIARGLATSLIGSDGKIDSAKMPTVQGTEGLEGFTSIGKLTDPSLIEGKTVEEILLMMLYGIVTPTLTEPKLSIALSDENAALIIGRPSNLKGALTFDRGEINPAFGTSGYRAGLPTRYLIGETVVDTTDTQYDFDITLTPQGREVILNYGVSYGEGEQPLDSIGRPFGAQCPAGIISLTLPLTAAYELYAADGTTQNFEWFEDEEDKGSGYLSAFGLETATEKQSFMVSTEMTIIGIKSYNVLSKQWEWLGGETAAVSLTHFDTTVIEGDSLGETTDYVLYTHN